MSDELENAQEQDGNATNVLRRRILKKAQDSIDQGRGPFGGNNFML